MRSKAFFAVPGQDPHTWGIVAYGKHLRSIEGNIVKEKSARGPGEPGPLHGSLES
jgi:hypothetical protein